MIALTIAKVFVIDISTLTDVYRALSFICLGLVLMPIGWLYQRIRSDARRYRFRRATLWCSQKAKPVIRRSRAVARRLEGWPHAPVLAAHPSRLAVKNGEHLRMTEHV